MTGRLRILVVDDEPQIHRFLSPALDAAGFEPVRAETGREALAEIARRPPDAVVLDLGLPDMDGQAVLAKARAFYAGPIIILSARDRELEKIEALDAGADDYVEKPFGVGELLARVRATLRRHRQSAADDSGVVQFGDVAVDLKDRRVTKAGQNVHLTPTEYRLLAMMVTNAGRVVTRAMLLEHVWDLHFDPRTNIVETHMSRLRGKIDRGFGTETIRTVRGAGYVIRAD